MSEGRTRATRGLASRVLTVTIGSAFVGLASALFVMRMIAVEATTHVLGPALLEIHRRTGAASCEAHPATWTFRATDEQIAFGYDGATRRSDNPAAPPLDAALADEASRDPGYPFAFRPAGVGGPGVFVMRAQASGPCAFVQSQWVSQHVASARVLWGLVAAMGVAIAGTLLGMGVVVRPLLRRIEALRKLAETMGDSRLHNDSMHPPRGDGDEIDAVHASLRRAHTRIVDDAKTLADQRDALGRHLADVSHDLRTPIASLQLTLEEIGDRAGEGEARALVAAALRDAVYLGGLVENLRLASLLEASASTPPPSPTIDLSQVVETVARRCRIFAKRQRASLEVALPDDAVEVACDPVWVERALANVVENAVTHVGVDGHVAILLEIKGDRFEVAVLDDGPGVAEGELDRLGERTFRSDDARKRDARGTGLGLAITREVCRRYGWTIEFSRVDPRGLRVALAGPVVARGARHHSTAG